MKKLISLILVCVMALSLCACGSSASNASGDKTYTVGICQLVQHAALDSATQGFKDALTDAFGDSVVFDEQIAAGDISTCATICNGFAADKVDLILANATPALQAAQAATDTIPVLGTAVTEYGVALDISDFTGTVGGNVSGTSDLAPLDQQAQMILDLFPSTKTVAVLYCSSEANSVYQFEKVAEYLESKGITVLEEKFTDSSDVSSVTQSACDEADVLFIPTDNVAASSAETIGNIAETAGVPVITGEEGPCAICGVATLTIDYYQLGRVTGEMAAKILKGESNISEMEIQYDTNPVKKYNADMAELYSVEIPADFVAIG